MMVRKLELLILSALATVALVALAPAAQAEPTFTVPGANEKSETTLTLLKDGTGSTAHWVFDITDNGALTCDEVIANEFEHDGAMLGSKATHLTIVTPLFKGCTFLGQAATAQNTGCSFTFKANGGFDIVPAGVHLCEHKREAIKFSAAGCTVEIGKQSLNGAEYHTVKDGASGKNVVTAKLNVANLSYEAYGAGCISAGTKSTGALTTGNSIITGEDNGFKTVSNLEWEP